MEQHHIEAVQKIRVHAKETNALHDNVMDLDASGTRARLEHTVQELQARVQEQQAALELLRSHIKFNLGHAACASDEPRQKLRQLLAVKDAYTRLKPTATFLPSQSSMLPALLAIRNFQQNIKGTKEAIASTETQLAKTTTILRHEKLNLHDADLLTKAMEKRIEQLHAQHDDRLQKTPAQLARELVAAKYAKRDSYNNDAQRLGEAMNNFVNDYLSSMIAAEELGGPVVGDMLDVEEDTLAAGFTKKGRAKLSNKAISEKSRQLRIDQIWGNESALGDEQEPPTEAEAADAEMRQLIGDLFATLIGPGGGKAYYQLKRDSAASRFLVRAKIAHLHPKDAKKLRLVDFGRVLEA
ncbi:hypothetical protein BKA66DRAFT_405680 [Pyrenochaeta sp. MPI-SDFR-AT-0127]|nr:hypothetical protein BKA66DRAFT_405680 [Pyrenochaeta sp. MPI-SDFR-AT-0127]